MSKNQACFIRDNNHGATLNNESKKFDNKMLGDFVSKNAIGYHHAGLSSSDQQLIENLFLNDHLPVLCNITN